MSRGVVDTNQNNTSVCFVISKYESTVSTLCMLTDVQCCQAVIRNYIIL